MRLIGEEGVCPSDDVLLYIGDKTKKVILERIQPALEPLGVTNEAIARQAVHRDPRTVIATTPHSFKGYDAEVVIIPHVERYVREGGAANSARTLYVAMTRARSLLKVYGVLPGERAQSRGRVAEVFDALDACLDSLHEAMSDAAVEAAGQDGLTDILEVLGEEYRGWLGGRSRAAHP